ncbi:SIMPL domain-containing protein [Mucilaginibacter koreensis]
MKKLFLLAGLLCSTLAGFSQAVDLRNRIEVSGSAEQEITPDIIYVSVSLREYMDGKNKVTIDRLENQLEKAVTAAGVVKADFTISNVSSYNYTTEKKKNPDFLASKQYRLKLHDLNRLDQIMAAVDPKGIQSTNVEGYDYSKLNDLRKQMRVKALLNAREKAGDMLTGIGEKLGRPISIVENDDINLPSPRPVMYMARMEKVADASMPESDVSFKNVKLTYSVRVVFEIVK